VKKTVLPHSPPNCPGVLVQNPYGLAFEGLFADSQLHPSQCSLRPSLWQTTNPDYSTLTTILEIWRSESSQFVLLFLNKRKFVLSYKYFVLTINYV
jgi:hypothetical protein